MPLVNDEKIGFTWNSWIWKDFKFIMIWIQKKKKNASDL